MESSNSFNRVTFINHDRQAYFEDLEKSDVGKLGYTHSRGNDDHLVNSITVKLLGAQWPEENGQPISIKNIFNQNHPAFNQMVLKCIEIRRIQSYIEQRVDVEIKVHDIKGHDAVVRYALPEFIEKWEIQKIINELQSYAENEVFSIGDITGNTNGTAILPSNDQKALAYLKSI